MANRQTVVGITLGLMGGCSALGPESAPVNRVALKHRALEVLQAAVHYEPNPVVRVQAAEALASCRSEEGLPWVRSAMMDDHPAVRFAACIAVGELQDGVSKQSLRKNLTDTDHNVQAAAIYGLHRLGDTSQTGRLSTFLLEDEDVAVRRNAAILLGMLAEPSAVKVLARAMGDPDEGVRHYTLEAMARLGNDEACQELAFMANSGVGSTEAFAIHALAQSGRQAYVETFRYKLATSDHLEVRLAAAQGLGMLGLAEGSGFALRALRGRRPLNKDPKDSPGGQILRGRQMAARVLGTTGCVEALPSLAHFMEDERDPRVQVSGAQAILEILAKDQASALPFAKTASHRVK